ncbi:response regulator transcription factor [Thioclava sp. GXIMD4215]|uniref:helix-turn-helix transcriptional regulator n=1 Tax=Thioclava sp. GXIMD4215 TaxID=3131928 RepID=UPI0032504627
MRRPKPQDPFLQTPEPLAPAFTPPVYERPQRRPFEGAYLLVGGDGRISSQTEAATELLNASDSFAECNGQFCADAPVLRALDEVILSQSLVPVRLDVSDSKLGRITCHIFAHKGLKNTALVYFWAAHMTPEPAFSTLLSKRELQIFHMIADGMRRDQIAFELSISLATIDLHMTGLRRKLGAKTLPEAVARGYELGLR